LKGFSLSHSLVVAPQSEAVRIALAVLEGGGNAFDAAVAGAFVQGVVDPHRCGIGGFGAACLYSAAEGRVAHISYFGRAGRKSKEDQWVSLLEGPAPDGFGYILENKENDVGYRSITVPGAVAGLGAIHDKYCSLPWADLVRPAAELARRGFLVRPHMASFWRRPGLFGRVSTRDRLGLTAEGRRLWLKNGDPPRAGETVTEEDLARTYERLAEAGPRDFYEGEIAEAIAADWEANDALATREDLAGYRPSWEEPLRGTFLGCEIATSPLPGGGVALLQALFLAGRKGALSFPLNAPPYIDALAEVFRGVQDDRLRNQGDPAFTGIEAADLLSAEYLEGILARTDPGAFEEGPDTTQLAAVDKQGNAIVLCHSLGYGSGVFTPGLGFMYNNCMSGFDPRPGRPNSIAPGKARTTAVAQTAILEKGRLKAVLGSPVGARITAALTQVILNVLHFGLGLQDAVCRPRFDAYRSTLVVDSRMPFDLENSLGGKWQVKRSVNPFGVVGRVYGVLVEGERPRPGYDPGEPGTAGEL